jgi:hypothetical protein
MKSRKRERAKMFLSSRRDRIIVARDESRDKEELISFVHPVGIE